jgi:hypothetical protein
MKNKDQVNMCSSNRLCDLVKHSLNFQVLVNKVDDENKTIPKHITLLKDMMSQSVQKKFVSEHLSGYSYSFSKKLAIDKNYGNIMDDSLEKDQTAREINSKPYPYNYDEEEEFVAQTIDLDQRDFYSTQKLKNKNLRSRVNKADTIRGVSYKHDGKIDVGASIDMFSKNINDVTKTPKSKFGDRRNSGVSTSSVMRLESYRSIQHEPSHQEKSEYAYKSNYSVLKNHKERFSSPKPERGDDNSVNEMTFPSQINDKIKNMVTGRNTDFDDKSQMNSRSVLDLDESSYNVLTMREKGYVIDSYPIRTG